MASCCWVSTTNDQKYSYAKLRTHPSSLPKALTYLTHQLMILIDCFVLSGKGAGCNSPAQRAGCAGHLVSSAESAKCAIARRKLRHDASDAKRMPRLQRSTNLWEF